MAAGSKPHERVGRFRNEVQHPVGTGTRLEFGSVTRGALGHNCRTPGDVLVVQPAQSLAEQVLQPTLAEHVATKRLWRREQRIQLPTI